VDGLEAEVMLPVVDVTLPLAEAYEQVTFEQPDDEQHTSNGSTG
jgi:hypothetical protein